MNKIVTISILVLAFVGGFFIFYNPKPVSNPAQESSLTPSPQQKWEAKIDEQENVTVTVTPIDLSSQSKEWKFDVIMDTHSVELDQDMTKVAVLIDDQGKEYKPLAWDGPTGGHHREGTLTFARITPTPKSVELKITGIADVVRSFMWQL
jgi:hypothetical protein